MPLSSAIGQNPSGPVTCSGTSCTRIFQYPGYKYCNKDTNTPPSCASLVSGIQLQLIQDKLPSGGTHTYYVLNYDYYNRSVDAAGASAPYVFFDLSDDNGHVLYRISTQIPRGACTPGGARHRLVSNKDGSSTPGQTGGPMPDINKTNKISFPIQNNLVNHQTQCNAPVEKWAGECVCNVNTESLKCDKRVPVRGSSYEDLEGQCAAQTSGFGGVIGAHQE